MHKWVSAALVMAFLSGCAEPTADESGEEEIMEVDEVAPFLFDLASPAVLAANSTVAAGQAFNVTLAADPSVNATAAANATWSLAVHAIVATRNATANSTSNATDTMFHSGQNVTYNGTATWLADGTGLPANATVNLTAGSWLLLVTASAPGYAPQNASMVITAIAAAVEEIPEAVDPCEGVVFEPVTISGSFTAAVAGSGFYSSNPFSIPPCVTSMYAEVTGDTLMVDIMLRLRDSGNSQEFASSNSQSGSTEDLEWAPKGGIEAGNYDLNVRGQVAGPGNYEGTITFA